MKVVIFFLFLLSSFSFGAMNFLFQAQAGEMMLGDATFLIIKEPYHEYDSQGVSMRIYREDKKQNLNYSMTFVLEDKTGGCSGKSIQKGTFRIEKDSLILYTFWDRSGIVEDAPYGFKKSRFVVQKDALLKEVSSEIYIEEHRRNKEDLSGMNALFTKPKTEEEKEKLAAYVARMEKWYKGKFLFGQEAEDLRREVESAFKSEKKSVWKEYHAF